MKQYLHKRGFDQRQWESPLVSHSNIPST